MRFKVLKLVGGVCLLMLAIGLPLHAASNGVLSLDPNTSTRQTPLECNDIDIEYRFHFTGTTNDVNNRDVVAVTSVDAKGVVLDVDYESVATGSTVDEHDGVTTIGSSPISARPITVTMWDIGDPGSISEDTPEGYQLATSGRMMSQLVVDPASLTINGVCHDLPFISNTSTCLVLPTGSVVGNTPYPTQVYWEPGKASPGVVLNPGNYWVIGKDESSQFYKILLSCQFVWVPVANFQPDFESPWNGQPLPTAVVK